MLRNLGKYSQSTSSLKTIVNEICPKYGLKAESGGISIPRRWRRECMGKNSAFGQLETATTVVLACYEVVSVQE